jgi:uncharacterized OB-fold protein
MCPFCQATETDWAEACGRGTLYSWVVATHPVHSILVDQVPYVVGLVELEEGVRVVANVDGCAPDRLTGDMPVELYFEEPKEDVRLPNFRVSRPIGERRST